MELDRVSGSIQTAQKPRENRQRIDLTEVSKGRQTPEYHPAPQGHTAKHDPIVRPGAEAGKEQDLVRLGKVSGENPNVSSLLVKHQGYRKECWRIIHSEVNRHKPYTRIRPGTEIFLNQKTGELVWGKDVPAQEAPRTIVNSEPLGQEKARSMAKPELLHPEEEQKLLADTKSFCERLVGAVEPFLGRPYSEIDCYELVVKGLTNLGVQYQGQGGLGRKLMEMAKVNGLPAYSYLNGEGLIAASGSKLYYKAVPQVKSPEEQAKQVINEIKPHLEKGLILSFSTHSRGHTGIVSQANDDWTFINSGRMDNPVASTAQRKGVGEESLEAEIRDWFKLAQNRKESLQITLGRLDEKKLVAFYDQPSTTSKKA